MKYFLILLLLVLAVGGAWFWLGRSKEPANRQPQAMGPLERVRAGEVVLIDVRTDEEWAAGHAKEAIHFDSQRVDRGELPPVAKDKPIYLYCWTGHRAGQVKTALEQAGYLSVNSLGGLQDMQALGAEMVR